MQVVSVLLLAAKVFFRLNYEDNDSLISNVKEYDKLNIWQRHNASD